MIRQHPLQRYRIVFCFLMMLGWMVAVTCWSADQEKPLNVLLITGDDLGLQLSCYGDTLIRTPHLDKLADRGTRFEVAYVTQASCSPSRSSMFTGLYPHATGQYGLTGRPNRPSGFELHEPLRRQTIPNILHRAGYRTGIIGKLHVAPEKSFHWDLRSRVDTRQVRDVAQAASGFLNAKDERPFFLMVNYNDPHAFRDPKDPRKWYFPEHVDGIPEKPLRPSERTVWPFQRVDTPEQRLKVANYYNCVRRLDEGVGMLLEALEQAGHKDNTLILFCGDHGPPFERGKTTCYESGTRVPFMVHWPGLSQVGVSPAMVSTVDILPTILDATGLPLPEGLHGRSLRPVLQKRDAPWRKFLAAEFHFHGWRPFFPRRAIRDQRYHLIHNLLAGSRKPGTGIDGDRARVIAGEERYQGTDVRRAFERYANPPEFELFDLSKDPGEFHNLAGHPEHAEVEARLKLALKTWRIQTGDPLLDPEKLKAMANHRPPPAR